MKIVFYILFGLIGILGVYFVGTSLFGRFHLWDLHPISSRIILIIAAIMASRLLYQAYLVAEVNGKWLHGIGWLILSVLAFQLTILLGAWIAKFVFPGVSLKKNL